MSIFAFCVTRAENNYLIHRFLEVLCQFCMYAYARKISSTKRRQNVSIGLQRMSQKYAADFHIFHSKLHRLVSFFPRYNLTQIFIIVDQFQIIQRYGFSIHPSAISDANQLFTFPRSFSSIVNRRSSLITSRTLSMLSFFLPSETTHSFCCLKTYAVIFLTVCLSLSFR